MFWRVAGRPGLPRLDRAAQRRRTMSRCQRRTRIGRRSRSRVWAACSAEDEPLDRGVPGDEEESVMGVAKKAKHKAKTAKHKTKKDAGKVKHKGKKAKNAAKH